MGNFPLSLVVILSLMCCFSGVRSEVKIPRNETPSDESPSSLPGARLYVVYMGRSTAFVEFDLNPTDVLTRILSSGAAAARALVYTYSRTFCGFAAILTPQQAERLRDVPGVVSVFLSRSVQTQTTSSYKFLGFDTASGVWPQSNFGQNVIVGVLDSGVWPESKSFDDTGMPSIPLRWRGSCQKGPSFGPENCNRKLIGARYFVKGYEAVHGRVDETSSDPGSVYRSPRDSEGHGTHTASTAVGRAVQNVSMLGLGQGTATGGAPSARLAVYKVCWELECNCADILAAFDHALADGVDLLSLSLGSATQDYFEDCIAVGGFHAVAERVAVVVSGGNSGPFGGGISNAAPWLLTVAASTINRQFLAKVTLGNGQTFKGVTINTYTLKANRQFPLVFGGDIPSEGISTGEASYCGYGDLDPAAVSGKIVLCRLGGGSADRFVSESGGVGVIYYSNYLKDTGFFFSVPAAQVDDPSGAQIRAYINTTSSPTARIDKSETVFDSAPAPLIASFSSRGPNLLTPNILKPDITAPGVDIFAAWSPARSVTTQPNDDRKLDYAILSGTSMSCPHVTAAAALLKSLYPFWSPAAIKSALMTTATPLPRDGSLSGGRQGHAEGSGQVNALALADPGLVYEASARDYVVFLCAIGYSARQIRQVTGEWGACPRAQPSVLDLNYPSVYVSTNRSVSTSVRRTLTCVGRAGSRYRVSVEAPPGVRLTVSPSTLWFSGPGSKKSFTVNLEVDFTSISTYSFGSVTWFDGTHSVRIPVGVGLPY